MTEPLEFGVPTLQSRVESWECDFNDHWNARFQGRAFQHAAEVVACRAGGSNPGGATIRSRTMRFHSEAISGDPVQVRSAAISSGTYQGAVVHLLFCSGRLASTALDLPGLGAGALPGLDPEDMPIALPRTLSGELPRCEWSPDAPGATLIETGPVRPLHLDHAGHPLFEEIIGRSATAVHDQLDRLGFTREFMERENTTRMAVETRVSEIGDWPLGANLRVLSRLTAVDEKTYRTTQDIVGPKGQLAARVEYNFLAVDTRTRRATAVPRFLTALSDATGAGSIPGTGVP